MVTFDAVTAEHACLKGEGDRTLEYWLVFMNHFLKRNWRK
ncbi:hypothetical protein WMZ97_08120 [Lentibacillus sp. N15]